MPRSPQWMDLYQIRFRVSSRGRNQLCGILLQSAHVFRFCEGSKFAISHWLGRSHSAGATAQPVILKGFKTRRQTDRYRAECRYRVLFPTSKYYVPRPLCGVAGNNGFKLTLHFKQPCRYKYANIFWQYKEVDFNVRNYAKSSFNPLQF